MTPGQRPLAEPPILDWAWFFERYIPSDLRYKALFPSDPENRSRMIDLDGERHVLSEYCDCVTGRAMRDDPEIDIIRGNFNKNLRADLLEDLEEVYQECEDIWSMSTDLYHFEHNFLDSDGRTTKLEQWIKKGADIFYELGHEVREKHQHLVPSDFVKNRVATFEFYWLHVNGGASVIERKLRKGFNILAGWPHEVQDKYGYLRPTKTQ